MAVRESDEGQGGWRRAALAVWRALPGAIFWVLATVSGFYAWLDEGEARAWALNKIQHLDFVRTSILCILIGLAYFIVLWWLSRKPRSGREAHQRELREIALQHERAFSYLEGIKLDTDWPAAREKCADMLEQSEGWIEANMGHTALAKYKSEGGKRIFMWLGDHDIVVRAERMTMMGTISWREENLTELHNCEDWDGDIPLRKRERPRSVGPWKETLWLIP